MTVVVLSGHTLFAEGVASRLRQHLERVELRIVDARQAGAFEQVTAAKPAAVIMDATDPEVTAHCPLGKLLGALPTLKVIRLDHQRNAIQVVTSEQRAATEVEDLIGVIQADS